MPFVVVDTNVSLPATLSSKGLTRKFWILLAFGAATYRADHLALDLDALERERADAGGEIGGREALQGLFKQADDIRGAIEELLPVGTPNDWVAVGGADLFSEYERKFESVAAKLGIDPVPDRAAARRQVEAVNVSHGQTGERLTRSSCTRCSGSGGAAPCLRDSSCAPHEGA